MYTAIVYYNSGANAVTNQIALDVDPAFTKVTAGSLVTTIDYDTLGGTWGDYDQDGYLDLLIYHDPAAAPTLYHNNRDGTFSQIQPASSGLNFLVSGATACWGDYDNDGYPDLFVTAQGTMNQLYHNTGKGTFTAVSKAGPLITDVANWAGAAWADYNNDGFIDMFVPVIDGTANSHCYLYKNNGDGTFTSVTNGPDVTDIGSGVGASWADYDNDGHIDLFVSGGRGGGEPAAPNRLYHNNGDGTFTRITNGAIATDVGHSGISAWGDYNNDGYLDLFVQNIEASVNFLYRNNGDGTFTRITNDVVAQDVASHGGTYSCAWGDYDNDGFLDLFVSNFSSNSAPPTVNFLYHNNGDGTFSKVTTGSIANEFSDTLGCSWVDYDNDGFLDLFVASGHGQGNYLYHNNGNTNAWVTVRLVGTASNRSAIGARVHVKAFYRGASRWQLRQITGGSGWAGHDEVQANFGLGDATNIDELLIEWPSGIVQSITNVTPRQILTVTEHQSTVPTNAPNIDSAAYLPGGSVSLSITGQVGLLNVLESSTNLINWTKIGVVSNAAGLIEFTDTKATNYNRRFYRVVIP